MVTPRSLPTQWGAYEAFSPFPVPQSGRMSFKKHNITEACGARTFFHLNYGISTVKIAKIFPIKFYWSCERRCSSHGDQNILGKNNSLERDTNFPSVEYF